MVKRISCRVIRTKPLDKSGEAMRHASSPNNSYHKGSDVITRPPTSYKSTSRNLTYTDLVKITRVSIDDGLTGQILDCYV